MAGTPAPFIELGVGFNPDLTARENVVLNGVMMGLSQREARRRLDAVLEFAELEEFVDLKLKNYSSGMLVRLAFSVMLQAEADIMLVDEVLAVGDAAFQQKCRGVFHQMREDGRTIVLVTHDMTAVQDFCHRAMLLEEGEVKYIGDPEEVGRRYLITNFERRQVMSATSAILMGVINDLTWFVAATVIVGLLADTGGPAREALIADLLGVVTDAWIENAQGERVTNVESGEHMTLRARVRASRAMDNPSFRLHFNNEDGLTVFALRPEHGNRRVPEGGVVELSASLENPLLPGSYSVVCWLADVRHELEVAQHAFKVLNFAVYGVGPSEGTVSVPGEMQVRLDPGVEETS